jgi:hypothetical protein
VSSPTGRSIHIIDLSIPPPPAPAFDASSRQQPSAPSVYELLKEILEQQRKIHGLLASIQDLQIEKLKRERDRKWWRCWRK